MLMPYLDVLLLFVVENSTLKSEKFQYLEIFGFIRIDFMCFSDKGFLEIYSVFHKKLSFSSILIIHRKKQLRQILRYVAHDSTFSKTILI